MDDGVHFFLFEGCLIRVPGEALSPKFGTLLLARHLPLRDGDRVLELGTGAGLIAVNPPQMPTPPGQDWDDALSRADNGGPDGWAVLDRIIREAPGYLKPGGRLAFTLFEFLGIPRGLDSLRAVGLEPRVLARATQPFPRLARERLEYLRSLDPTGVLPAGKPAQCVRTVLCGERGDR